MPNIDDNPFMNKIPDGHGGYITMETDNFVPKEEYVEKDEEIEWFDSLTPSAKQSWPTATEFPCCPLEVTEDGLQIYKENLTINALFSKGVYDEFYSYYVLEREINPNKNSLVVLTKNNGEEHEYGTYSLAVVTIENGFYIHMSFRRFSIKQDAYHFYKVLLDEEELTDGDIIMLDT